MDKHCQICSGEHQVVGTTWYTHSPDECVVHLKSKITVLETKNKALQARVEKLETLNVEELVNRFLAWPLPASVCSDTCASKPNYPHRSGTTLLTADEAKQMFTHVLEPFLSQLTAPPEGKL